jgi:hypothetical protein
MIRSPREKFISIHGDSWKKLVSTNPTMMEDAFNNSLLELGRDMPLDCALPQQACDAHQQMAGARKLLDILSSLHQPQTTPKSSQTKGLNYQAGV